VNSFIRCYLRIIKGKPCLETSSVRPSVCDLLSANKQCLIFMKFGIEVILKSCDASLSFVKSRSVTVVLKGVHKFVQYLYVPYFWQILVRVGTGDLRVMACSIYESRGSGCSDSHTSERECFPFLCIFRPIWTKVGTGYMPKYWISGYEFRENRHSESRTSLRGVKKIWSAHSTFSGPGSSVGIATELRAGRSGIESRWGWDFPPVQTGPGAHPASCKMGTGSFPGIKCGRGVLLTTRPLLVPRSWKSTAITLPTLWATPDL